MPAAILLVFTGIIAMITLAGAYWLIMPIFLNLHANPSADCQNSAQCTTIFDRLYDVMFIAFEMMTGGIFFALYARAARRDSVETYSGGEF